LRATHSCRFIVFYIYITLLCWIHGIVVVVLLIGVWHDCNYITLLFFIALVSVMLSAMLHKVHMLQNWCAYSIWQHHLYRRHYIDFLRAVILQCVIVFVFSKQFFCYKRNAIMFIFRSKLFSNEQPLRLRHALFDTNSCSVFFVKNTKIKNHVLCLGV